MDIIPASEAFLQEVTRAKRDVLRKIEKTFAVSMHDVHANARFQNSLSDKIDRFLKNEKKGWNHFLNSAGITSDEAHHTLTEIARETMSSYANAFLLRQTIIKKEYQPSSDPVYRQPENARMLMDIYVNHITREALAKIKRLGVSDATSFALCGALIKNIVSIYRKEKIYGHNTAVVAPVQKKQNSFATPEQKMSQVIDYWKELRDLLNEAHAPESRSH